MTEGIDDSLRVDVRKERVVDEGPRDIQHVRLVQFLVLGLVSHLKRPIQCPGNGCAFPRGIRVHCIWEERFFVIRHREASTNRVVGAHGKGKIDDPRLGGDRLQKRFTDMSDMQL